MQFPVCYYNISHYALSITQKYYHCSSPARKVRAMMGVV